ncbi:MAG: class I SAM-dependent methyltransferase [Actinomycetota bacterium]
MSTAAERWRDALGAWAIPENILRAAPESPWAFPVGLFTSRAQAAAKQLTFSNQRAREELPEWGTVLDVGCGAGAASLPLAGRASRLIGVDTSPAMLEEFTKHAEASGVLATTIEGTWPDVADRSPVADVVVCHHVVYNAPDLRTFALRLTDHARRRVVVEMTVAHPLQAMNDLWMRFHGVARPTTPTADDAEEVLREAGLHPSRHDWNAPRPGGFPTRGDLVASVRRMLCLGSERDSEIAAAIGHRIVERDGRFGFTDRPVATLWWEGAAPAEPTGGRRRSAPAGWDV